jgi:predicted kinase
MTGYSGSGKSWLSRRLIPGLEAIQMRSDLERKRLAGLSPTADSQSEIESGIYDPESTATVYDRLLETAACWIKRHRGCVISQCFPSPTCTTDR